MDRLVHADAAGRAERGAGQHAHRAGQHGGFVGEDVAEHVLGDDDVKRGGVADQVHGAGVDEAVFEGDVGVIGREFFGDFAPHAGGVEDVGLVDGGEQAAAGAGGLEAEADDPLDLLLAVGERVHRVALSVLPPAALRLAEVDAAGEFAQHDHVDLFDGFALERGAVGEEGEHLHRADVGEEAEALAQAEDGLLGAHGGGRVVPFGAADGAEEDGVLRAAHFQGFVAQGDAVGVDCGAADGVFAVFEGVVEAPADGGQHAHRFADHFGSDSVARQQRDAEVRHLVSPPCGGGCGRPARPPGARVRGSLNSRGRRSCRSSRRGA